MERDSFVFYRSFYDAIRKADDQTALEAVRAICAYALDGEEPELEGFADIIFDMAKPQIDANNKRRTDGLKGGRPKKPVVSENENHRLSEVKPNVNVNDNVNVNVNANENVNVNDNESPTETRKKVKKEKTPSLTLDQMESMIDESLLSTPLLSKIKDWVRYKQARNAPYKEMGFKSLRSQIHKYEMQDGVDAVIDVVDLSMSNDWKGIIWDKIEHHNKAQPNKGGIDWSKV